MRRVLKLSLLLVAALSWPGYSAPADEIRMPKNAFDRDEPIAAVYRLDAPATGRGTLQIEWTDALGRVVERRKLAVKLAHGRAIPFRLDPRRAVAIQNRLRAHLSFDDIASDDAKHHREADVTVSFVSRPPDTAWTDFPVIMWQPQTPVQYATLKQLGVTAGMIYTKDKDKPDQLADQPVQPLLQNDMRWYVENIATDFYSAYHRWTPDQPVNARFLQVQAQHQADPDGIAAFRRAPSLSDPAWLAKIRHRLGETVRVHAPYRPLFYNLGDEPGIADLSAYWDFDFSKPSLRAMRAWLRQGYGTLAALNAEWGSHFARWDEVAPMTTARALQQRDDNYAAWADFKAWMDMSFARALHAGTEAVHAADAKALAAIEGAQAPGWGGYDYTRLAHAVDAMEINDDSDDVEIARALNPRLILLSTTNPGGPEVAHRVWRALLRGSRGLILWDPKGQFVDANGEAGPAGRAAATYLQEIRGGLGALLIDSVRSVDPIAILYSPASMRTQWMLDWRSKGDAWSRQTTGSEPTSPVSMAMDRYLRSLEHSGLQARIVSSAEVEAGALRRRYRVLLLPDAIALSAAEAREIRGFAKGGGKVVADGTPGVFDQHSRKRAQSPLADVLPRATGEPLMQIIARAGVQPAFTISKPDGTAATDVEVHSFHHGGVEIIALQRDLTASAADAAPTPDREAVILELPYAGYIYDLRLRTTLPRTDRPALELDPFQPILLAVADRPLAAPTISVPARTRVGEIATLHVRSRAASGAASEVLHLDVSDPAGRKVPYYARNLRARRGEATVLLPLAANDLPGTWKIAVTDLLSGQTSVATLDVAAR